MGELIMAKVTTIVPEPQFQITLNLKEAKVLCEYLDMIAPDSDSEEAEILMNIYIGIVDADEERSREDDAPYVEIDDSATDTFHKLAISMKNRIIRMDVR
jgi:hypothetical protein